MKYTRTNSLIRSELATKRGNVNIPRALVYGDNKTKTTVGELKSLWNSKKRRVPLALMLAKAECESGFYPYIFRFEIGQYEDYANGWLSKAKGNTEFDATSGGLFQILGKNVHQWGYSDWTFLGDISNQLDAFDKMMGNCLDIAKRYTDKGEIDDVYQALNIYAYGTSEKNIYWKNALADKNYSAYKKYLKI